MPSINCLALRYSLNQYPLYNIPVRAAAALYRISLVRVRGLPFSWQVYKARTIMATEMIMVDGVPVVTLRELLQNHGMIYG
jgi:hypothetical protein